MGSKADNYTPVLMSTALRGQAIRVWAVALALVGIWTLTIVAAPVARAYGFEAIASWLYSFFSYICHQLPERSFHMIGEQFGVCSRCFGVYFGLFLGIAAYPVWRGIDNTEPIARFWLFLSLVPVSIDWSLTAFGIWENTQASRFITGSILGIACATFIMPAAVEIARNSFLKRSRSSARTA